MDFSELKRFLDSLPEMGIPGVDIEVSVPQAGPPPCLRAGARQHHAPRMADRLVTPR